MMKKLLLSCLLTLALVMSSVGTCFAFADTGAADASDTASDTETTAQVEVSTQREFRQLTADEIMYEMGAGWNLGNTLEGHNNMIPSETAWNTTVTTKAILEAVHDQGFNSVRIPVTWGNMVGDAPDYEIDDVWISRVQEVVDYAISLDMYVMINVHHDGAQNDYWLGLRFQGEEWDEVVDRFEGLWTNIAERFKDYDEHLIFESMNEIRGDQDTQEDTIKINQLNQTFVDAVRKTGGNNTKRWLAVTTEFAWIWELNQWWELPDDEYCTVDSNRLMVKTHNYTYQSVEDIPEELGVNFRGVVDQKAAAKGITETVPCLLGEFGYEIDQSDYEAAGNKDPRTAQYGLTYVVSQVNGIVPFYWDTSGEFGSSLSFTIFEREYLRPAEELIDTWKAMLRGMYEEPDAAFYAGDYSNYDATPEVTAATSITLSETSLELGINEQATVEATMDENAVHDIVLWTSSDDDVATVTRGIIRGRSAGVATITAYSLEDSSVKATLTVKVTAEKKADSAESLTVLEETTYEDGTYVAVPYGGYVDLTVYAPAATSDTLSFASSDEDIATVNTVGKVTAIATGSATITIMASGGASTTVKVVVGAPGEATSFDVSIVVNYNSQSPSWAGTPVGETITVTGDGQYSITFDLAEHRPDDMPAALTTLDNISVIYLVDEATRTGAATSTPINSADIRYDTITISNGTESADLEIVPDAKTDPETMFRSALNASGAFNTGGPINAWGDENEMGEMSVAYEGYYTIERVGGWNPVLTWTAVEGPTSITITFTLDNVEFTSSEVDPGTPAESLLRASASETAEVAIGASMKLGVMVAPAETTSSISFVSSDSTVAMVSNTKGVAIDDSGYASIEVYGVGEGTATITAMTENGYSVTYEVTVVDASEPAVDKTALQSKYDEVKGTTSEGYTSESYAAFSTALTEAKAVLDNAEATQEEVNEALTALTAAYEGLEEEVVVPAVDKTALQSKYDEVKGTESEGYTSESYAAFSTALTEAKAVLDDAEATQEEVNEALTALTAAYEGLEEEVVVPAVDKTALQSKYDEVKGTESEGYTSESYAAFSTALTEAKAVLDDAEATQEEVNEALTALTAAYEGLEEAEEPGTEEPGTEEPGTEEPGTEDPGTEEPEEGEKGGCASNVSASLWMLALPMLAAGAILISCLRKKE